MPVTISVSETRYIELNSGSADEPPIWGVIFQLNRDDGIGTAIGVTVRCDDETDAREHALSKLQGFLSEASAAADALTPSTPDADAAESQLPGDEPRTASQEIDQHKAREEAAGEGPGGMTADEIDQENGHRVND